MTVNERTDRIANTMQEMIEAQRKTYEALTDSFIEFQERNARFVQSGMDLAVPQEDFRVARGWWTSGLRLMESHQRHVRLVQSWISGGADYLRNQAEYNHRAAEVFAESARAQQEGLRKLGEDWVSLYEDAASSTASYAREGAQLTQDATQGGPRKKEWDEADHRRNPADGRFGPGEEWDESAHTRDTEGQFT